MFGGQFLIGLALAIAAYVVLYYRALKYRRKVWVHSGYMLATPLILFESPFSRLIGTGHPGPAPSAGREDFHLIMPSILWAMARRAGVIAADLAQISRQGEAVPGRRRLHRRADADHGPDGRTMRC